VAGRSICLEGFLVGSPFLYQIAGAIGMSIELSLRSELRWSILTDGLDCFMTTWW
jgi:hypothetical protein